MSGLLPAEGDLVDRGAELALRSLGRNLEGAFVQGEVRPGPEQSEEVDLLGRLADVDEAAGAGERVPNLADVDVAGASASAMPRKARSSPPPS